MASYKTRTRTIRIKNETDDYFKGKQLNRAVDSMKELLENGTLSFDGENLTTNADVHTVSETEKDLLDMLRCFRKTEDELLSDVHDLMEQGVLTYQNGTLTIDLGFDYQAFLDFCIKRKANPATVWKNLGKEIGF